MSIQLNDLRDQISELDNEILILLSKRMLLSWAIAEYKKQNGLPIYDPVRENELFEKYSEKVDFDILPIYRAIMDESKRLQTLHVK